MMWHVVFAERGGLPQSRAARSRDSAIRVACELLSQSCDVRRVIEPNGSFIERGELDEHFDSGRFPGLRRHPSSMEAVGFELRAQLIWAKQSLVIGRGHYHWQHEPCWYAVRGTGHWQGDRKQSTVWQIAAHGQDADTATAPKSRSRA